MARYKIIKGGETILTVQVEQKFTLQIDVNVPNGDDPFHTETQDIDFHNISALRDAGDLGYTIEELAEHEVPDGRFYTFTEDPQNLGSYITTARDLSVCKAEAVENVKRNAYALLRPTDWKITRAAETGEAADADLLTAREAVRTHSNALEAEVNALSSIEDLAAWSQHDWPAQP